MQDIRNFFKSSSEKKKAEPKPANSSKKNGRKRVFIDSDSDEEPIKTPKRAITKNKAKSSTKKLKEDDSTSKYFEVDKNKVKNLFGTEPVKQVIAPPKSTKNMVVDELSDISSAFLDMDEDDEGWVREATRPKKSTEKLSESPPTHPSSKAHDHSISPAGTPEKRPSISEAKKSPTKSPIKLTSPAENVPVHGGERNSPVTSHHTKSPVNKLDKTNEVGVQKVVSKSPTNNLKVPENKTAKINGFENSRKDGSSKMKASRSEESVTSSTAKCTSLPAERKLKDPKFELWVEKYKPTSLKQIIGQQGDKSNVNKLLKWLKAWHNNHSGNKKIPKPSPWAKDDSGAYFKAALLSGPPGVGKTTAAHLVCKELEMDAVEFNASDTRSKKLLHSEIGELLSNKSMAPFAQGGAATSKNHVLIMDEVDGMAGNEDRGGIQELIALIKGSKVPVICMCNDRHHPKIRSLVNYCFDLRFSKPRADQIKGAMMSICFKEGMKIQPDVLNSIITCTNQDIRLVLNHLSMLAAKHDSEMIVANKELKLGPWDVLRKVFTENEHKGMSIHDKLDLFFHDYSIAPLFVQENYLNVVPHAADAKSKAGKMKLYAQAASSLCNGDLVDKAIRSQNAWSLLPTQALYTSLVPGEVLEGHVGGMINFPSWLGKFSKQNKMNRLAQEIQSHTRLKASASNEAIRLDYAPALRDSVLFPLIHSGNDGVEKSLEFLREYSLLREDVESLNELASWPGSKDLLSSIESKVKAAFTRAYNKNPVLTPFSTSSAGVKKGRSGQEENVDIYEGGEEALDVDEEENDDDDGDPLADGMILVKKKTKAESSKDAAKKKGSAEPSKARGGSRGRGKKR